MFFLSEKILNLLQIRTKGEGGCLVWTGMVDSMGYAFAKMTPTWPKGTRVSRMVLSMKLGRKAAITEWACHTCDNPLCVNPDHVYCGNATTNNRDTVARNRRGVRKLTAEQNKEILNLYASRKFTQTDLAERYGVSQVRISQIIRRPQWQTK